MALVHGNKYIVGMDGAAYVMNTEEYYQMLTWGILYTRVLRLRE